MSSRTYRGILLKGATTLHTTTYRDHLGNEHVQMFGKNKPATVESYLRELEHETGKKVLILPFEEAVHQLNCNRFIKYCGPWEQITKERFDEMLGVLPPEKMQTVDGVTIFRLCEYQDGNYTQHFAAFGNKYLTAVRSAEHSYETMAKDIRMAAALGPGEICQHPSPRWDGSMCNGLRLEKMPIGVRCADCAGMHHHDGTRKTDETIASCTQGCCGHKL